MYVEYDDDVAPVGSLPGHVSEPWLGQGLLDFLIVPALPSEGQLPSFCRFVAAEWNLLLSLTGLEQREIFGTRPRKSMSPLHRLSLCGDPVDMFVLVI